MRLECFICEGPDPKAPFIVDRLSPTNGCWGLCKLCGIAVCTGHGLRHENPNEYQCAICVGPGMKRRGPGGNDPSQPTSPEPTPDEFLSLYSNLKIEILDAMRAALEEHFGTKYTGSLRTKKMDGAARNAAASAYAEASGVAKFMAAVRQASRELAGSGSE